MSARCRSPDRHEDPLRCNLSPQLVERLRNAGFETAHVADIGLLTSSDEVIFDHAAAEGWVLITADSDFSMLLALRSAGRPSVVLLRHVAELRPDAHGDLLIANLPAVVADLEAGAVVSLSPARLSVRRLPLSAADSIER
jgi:predicted nuclease of predicted toxin-antitoxin system